MVIHVRNKPLALSRRQWAFMLTMGGCASVSQPSVATSSIRQGQFENSQDLLRELIRQGFLTKTIGYRIVEEFCSGCRIVNGKIAHMHYGPIYGSLSETEFNRFLNIVRIPKFQFAAFKDSICDMSNGPAAEGCINDPGHYCDPQICHGH